MFDASETISRSDVWRRYREQGDDCARERLILAYAPLVELIAAQMANQLPSNIEQCDLVSYGLFGLISAMERFDPAREVKFETFASVRIKGAIIDELRSIDWVPRSVRREARKIRAATSELERRLHRPPTVAETAAALDITVDRLHASLEEGSNTSVLTLDDVRTTSVPSDGATLLETIDDPDGLDPTRELDTTELRDHVAHAVTRLPERERLVIGLYYYDDLTLLEIGSVLGVARSRAAQLRTRAVARLRSVIQEDMHRVIPRTS